MRAAQRSLIVSLGVFTPIVCLADVARPADDVIRGAVKDVVLSPGKEYVFGEQIRCRKLLVNGDIEIRHEADKKEVTETPHTITLACDSIELVADAKIRTWSHLRWFGGAIKGPLTIYGLRNRAGADGAAITQSGQALNGQPGASGGNGGNGRNARTDLQGDWGSEGGGAGGSGQRGTDGKNGTNGNPGLSGEANVAITVHALNFDGQSQVRIENSGGRGGNASDGQNGGSGGAGGSGGNGGSGGRANAAHSASNGGGGGNGGRGGDGGDGGIGGNGGAGGDGGRIEVIIDEDVNGRGVRPSGAALVNFGGDGGAPGIAGKGGVGGPGGAAGAGGQGGNGQVWNGAANPGGGGAPGLKGNDGRDGKNGEWGKKGKKGETVENILGYGTISKPTQVNWDLVTQ
ncbi:hypothetical protein [Bradyrhizobium sp. RT3a]|jgi:hypothetical protein|uniref:hypothetical protein n=1 Tax=unclassified Bradyrhizobium TaxID=2631580 RepID=UPI003397F260